MEGKFVFQSDTNQLFDSLIDTRNRIDDPAKKSDRLDVDEGLDMMKLKMVDGAKIVHQAGPCLS